MVTKAKEYRKQKTKEVTLPSGAVFLIRKMTPEVFAKIADKLTAFLPGGTNPTGDIRDVAKSIREFSRQDMMSVLNEFPVVIRAVFPACVVEPRIVEANPTEDELAVDDIELMDSFELFHQIFEFSTITGPLPESEQPSPTPPSGRV